MIHAKARLYLTAARDALVAEGDPAAASLYCTPGDQIPDSVVERFGLVDGALPDGGAKERKGGSNKERPGGGDKGAGGGDKGAGGGAGEGGASASDDLTTLKYVGAAIAAKLAEAGLNTFAAIAALDPAAPPADLLPPTFRWADVIAGAKAKVPAVVAETEAA